MWENMHSEFDFTCISKEETNTLIFLKFVKMIPPMQTIAPRKPP